MSQFYDELRADLADLEARSLRRGLRELPSGGPVVEVDGRPLVNLASNDYLGLASHPRLRDAAIEATRQHGTGSGASRLVAGHLAVHAECERRFALFKHAESALLLPTGYMANLAVLTALAGPGDRIFLDKLNHASLIDAARFTGAEVRTFPHLNDAKLERMLERPPSPGRAKPQAAEQARPPRTFIVTDSVFSMDGDVADLSALAGLAEAHDAVLIVDEAHGTGVLGPTGAGMAELQGVGDRVDITVSTASKALGGLGGIVTARREVIDTLVNRARPLVYTTGVPPAQAAAITAALGVVIDEPWRRERVLAMSAELRGALSARGWTLPPTNVATPIVPLVVGEPAAALALAARLQAAGLLGVAIRPPTVAPGSARVRLSLRADLGDDIVRRVLDAAGGPPA